MVRSQRRSTRRLWPWTSFAVAAIALVAAAPAAALFFGVAHLWCHDQGWPLAVEFPMTLACLAVLYSWRCGVRAQREWIATFAEPLSRDELPRVLPALPEVQRQMACPRELEVWLMPVRGVNAEVIGSRQLVITAGLAGEPPRLQAAVLAHELAHLRLGHALTSWTLERCMSGYDELMRRWTRQELDSRIVPGSFSTALVYALTFTILAVPLLLLRLTGFALGRQMEWEADCLAARNGYGESLDTVLGRLARAPDERVQSGLFTLKAQVRTHPLLAGRREALRTGRMPRTGAVRTSRHLAISLGRVLTRVARSVAGDVVNPPVDGGTLFMAWFLADVGAVQSTLSETPVGAGLLIPLALVALRGRPRRPMKRPRLLRRSLWLTLIAYAAIVAAPSMQHDGSTGDLVDAAWFAGTVGIALGVGVRAWLAAIMRGIGLMFLPGRYAQRLLRPPPDEGA